VFSFYIEEEQSTMEHQSPRSSRKIPLQRQHDANIETPSMISPRSMFRQTFKRAVPRSPPEKISQKTTLQNMPLSTSSSGSTHSILLERPLTKGQYDSLCDIVQQANNTNNYHHYHHSSSRRYSSTRTRMSFELADFLQSERWRCSDSEFSTLSSSRECVLDAANLFSTAHLVSAAETATARRGSQRCSTINASLSSSSSILALIMEADKEEFDNVSSFSKQQQQNCHHYLNDPHQDDDTYPDAQSMTERSSTTTTSLLCSRDEATVNGNDDGNDNDDYDDVVGQVVQVAPGVERMRFVGTMAATWEAILDGRITIIPCACCTRELYCWDIIEFVLCPECGVTSPVVLLLQDTATITTPASSTKYYHPPPMSSSSSEDDRSSTASRLPTIGIGFTSDWILLRLPNDE
jgi:hypothetical protein